MLMAYDLGLRPTTMLEMLYRVSYNNTSYYTHAETIQSLGRHFLRLLHALV